LATGDSLTIVGNGGTIDGGGAERGFLVYAGNVIIQDLTIQNAVAQGGAGGGGGLGGGGGAGRRPRLLGLPRHRHHPGPDDPDRWGAGGGRGGRRAGRRRRRGSRRRT